ncbi:MAG: hypothetical protein HOC91_02950 [Nitrospinaceae bacterium]|jgi:hypothetical protein|nr:hypothetical protein [Nitrospinaceae bacterium]MBT3432832.1 hypothetical protein [Nitrospinaceae bacterium]MBT4094100.1 hypothetical protein [Nitrospinaceae bacterium]MBT4429452.1 hypothetical protein [Nitrospinaceae bacterium]MBT5367681.1 hypothetical protein [Nitrospinaceae bacterium]
MVGRIAPYLANNVQQSYLRQQRVGERIAGAKLKDNPAASVEISDAARRAADEAHAAASMHRQQNIEEMTERFVDQYLEKPSPLPAAVSQALRASQEDVENADGGVETEDRGTEGESIETAEVQDKGRAAFISLIESFGLEVSQDDDGQDQAIVNKTTGEEVVPLSNNTREAIKTELSQLVKNILGEVL